MSKFGFLFDIQGLCCGPDCEWQFRSCVQFGCIWQAIVREDSRLQNASFKSCNVIIASCSPPNIIRIALQIMLTMTVCSASCKRSFSKLKLVL